jgi:hypothetical protein
MSDIIPPIRQCAAGDGDHAKHDNHEIFSHALRLEIELPKAVGAMFAMNWKNMVQPRDKTVDQMKNVAMATVRKGVTPEEINAYS